MNTLFVVVQALLVIAAVALLVTSLRTSRSRRSQHSGCLILAGLLAFLAIMMGLLSLASAAGDPRFNHVLSFLPPAVTLFACAWVAWRATTSANRPHRHRRRTDPAKP